MRVQISGRNCIGWGPRGLGVILLIMLVTGCAKYPMEGWDRGDTIRQLTITGLIVVDWAQTSEIKSNPNWEELNGIADSVPEEVYFPVCAALNFGASAILKPKWREKWQIFWLGAEGATVVRNRIIGVRP